jgi:MAD (mothers against decapentaplegic) interacting protein
MPFIPGLFVQMRLGEEYQEIIISICKSRHEQVVKALSSSNEHVLAFGASFNQRASAHFTCSKSDDGQYRSELFTAQNRVCEYRQLVAQSVPESTSGGSNAAAKSTSNSLLSLQSAFSDIGLPSDSELAANFVVFSGALKSSTGLTAKFSVVEDGFLVQISSSTLEQLKSSLKEGKDFTIRCGRVDSQTPDEVVRIVWEEEDKYFNVG